MRIRLILVLLLSTACVCVAEEAAAPGGWHNARDLGIEGQGWTNLKHPYDRLPADAEGVVPDPVWNLSHDSAGLFVRFMTDSKRIWVRWSLRDGSLAMPHMAATGVSGVDLYAKHDGTWGYVGTGRPAQKEGNEALLCAGAPDGVNEFMINLPLYNGIESLEIGIDAGSKMLKAPAYPAGQERPILFWGTSILQGGCASRPGMAYTSILARRLGCPAVNLGFSGNGKMDPEMTPFIAKVDAAAFVIDCAPNMGADLIAERTAPLVRALRAAHADTPIVLVENIVYQQSWFVESRGASYRDKNAALRNAYKTLRKEGIKKLSYIRCDDLLGHDNEATVDGTHATDLGFLRMADAIEPALRRVLGR